MALGNSWAKYRKDAKNSGRTDAIGITTAVLDWVRLTDVKVISHISIGPDGRLRFVGGDGKLYCMDSAVGGEGRNPIMWSTHPLGGAYEFNAYSNIVIDENNNNYIVCSNGPLQKYDSNGNLIWSTPFKAADSIPGNNIVFKNNGNLLLGLSTGENVGGEIGEGIGKIVEISYIDGQVVSGGVLDVRTLSGLDVNYMNTVPAMLDDWMVATFGPDPNQQSASIIAINFAFDPPQFWALSGSIYGDVNYRHMSAPVLDNNGRIYVIGSDGRIRQLSIVGGSNRINWDYISPDLTGFSLNMSISVDSNDNIYFADNSGQLYSLDYQGSLRWKVQMPGNVSYPVVVDGENNIYALCDGNNAIYKYAQNGDFKWSFNYSGLAVSAPSIAENGKIFIPTNMGITSIKQATNAAILGYNIYRSTKPTSGFVKITPSPIPSPVIQDVDLENGSYYYQVRAVSILGVESDNSDIIGPFVIDMSVPNPPRNLRFEPREDHIRVMWDSPNTNTDGSPLEDLLGFDVYKLTVPNVGGASGGTTGGNTTGFSASNKINTSLIIDNFFDDYDVVAGNFYYYAVKAKDVKGQEGPYSDSIRAAMNIHKMILENGTNVIGFPFNDDTLRTTTDGPMMVSKLVEKIGAHRLVKILRWNENVQAFEQYPDFEILEPKRGYVVVMNTVEPYEIDVVGDIWPQGTKVSFKSQLNLVNFPLNDYKTVTQLINVLGGVDNVKYICRYNYSTRQYEQYIPELSKGSFTNIEAGYGYFVFLRESSSEKNIAFAGGSWI